MPKLVTTQGHQILEAEGGVSLQLDIEDVSGLQAALDAAGGGGPHEHEIADISGLQTALDAKGTSSFSGSYTDLTDKPSLGDAAAMDVGTASGTVAAGDHTHAGGGSALDAWPVGSVYIAVDSTSPATRFGGGTWSAFGAGRMLVGINASDADFDTAEETGGAKAVTLTAAQSGLPQHTHVQNAHTHDFLPRSGTSGGVSSIVTGTLDTSSAIGGNNQPHVQLATAVNQNAGPTAAAESHTNMPPYIVCYFWKRTA